MPQAPGLQKVSEPRDLGVELPPELGIARALVHKADIYIERTCCTIAPIAPVAPLAAAFAQPMNRSPHSIGIA